MICGAKLTQIICPNLFLVPAQRISKKSDCRLGRGIREQKVRSKANANHLPELTPKGGDTNAMDDRHDPVGH